MYNILRTVSGKKRLSLHKNAIDFASLRVTPANDLQNSVFHKMNA